MSVKIERITEAVVLGEGPHWDERQQALFFVSINDKTIHKYVLATKERTKTTLDGRVSFIIPVEGTTDQFVVGVERNFLIVRWDGKEGTKVTVVKDLGEVDANAARNRLNDAKVDPKGRLYAGTMGYEDESCGSFEESAGSLFRLDAAKGHAIETLCDNISISNGFAWDLEDKAMYYIDSLEKNIRRYDYDVDTGDMSNMTYIFDFVSKGIKGLPDGMTIDTDGNLWVAVYSGSCVIQINPKTGKLLQKIPIPAEYVTSVTFGGPEMDRLFVTTASKNMESSNDMPRGCTFMVINLKVKGHPNVNFKY